MNFKLESQHIESADFLLAAEKLNVCPKTPLTVQTKSGDCLAVELKDGVCSITFEKKCEIFRGLSLLNGQLAKGVDSFFITEKRKLDSCCPMLDISSDGVMTVETLKDFMVRLALMGIDSLMLYAEDLYKVEKYPYFGYQRGAYSKEELKELVIWGERFGIELVPCIQTLAHLDTALRWYSEMRDSASVLLIDEPKTYAFLEECFKTVRECFTSKRIHIGMDEAFGIGFGQYFARHGYQDRYEMLCRHLKRVHALCQKYGFDEPMMWSDMFFSLRSRDGVYIGEGAALPPDLAQDIPEGITQVYWDYYGHDSENYKLMIDHHKSLGEKTIFAGGIWAWSSISLGYYATLGTTRAAMEACHEKGIRTVIPAIWGNANEINFYSGLLGLQLFAEFMYYPSISDEHLKESFFACTGGDADAFLLFDTEFVTEDGCLETSHGRLPVIPPGGNGRGTSSLGRVILYQDVLQGMFDVNLAEFPIREHFGTLLEKLKALPHQGDFEYLFAHHRLLVQTLYEKCDVGIKLYQAYRSDDRQALIQAVQQLKRLDKALQELHASYAALNRLQNKPFGFERMDLRLGGLRARVQRAIERVELYLNGTLLRLEELEEERLWMGSTAVAIPNMYASVDQMMTVAH